MFCSWGQIYSDCPACGFSLITKEPDTWFFMYMSTAGMTGLFMIIFFLVSQDSIAVRILVPAAAAFFFILTHPLRKSMAFAFDHWIEMQ